MIILIDNYDSFSYNLYQLVGTIDPDIKVIRNDELTVDEIRALKPSDHSFTGTGLSKGCGHLYRSGKDTGKRDTDIGCLPGTSGYLRSLWSYRFLCKRADARQAVHDNH